MAFPLMEKKLQDALTSTTMGSIKNLAALSPVETAVMTRSNSLKTSQTPSLPNVRRNTFTSTDVSAMSGRDILRRKSSSAGGEMSIPMVSLVGLLAVFHLVGMNLIEM